MAHEFTSIRSVIEALNGQSLFVVTIDKEEYHLSANEIPIHLRDLFLVAFQRNLQDAYRQGHEAARKELRQQIKDLVNF